MHVSSLSIAYTHESSGMLGNKLSCDSHLPDNFMAGENSSPESSDTPIEGGTGLSLRQIQLLEETDSLPETVKAPVSDSVHQVQQMESQDISSDKYKVHIPFKILERRICRRLRCNYLKSIEERVPCSFIGCNKTFVRLDICLRHERIHEGIKPFICSYKSCEKSFTRSDNLSRHELTHRKKNRKVMKKKP